MQQYVNKMNLEEIEKLSKLQRPRQNSPYGKTKLGNSAPRKIILNRDDIEFGIGSYHKRDVSNVKNVLQNEGLRDHLVSSLQRQLTDELI